MRRTDKQSKCSKRNEKYRRRKTNREEEEVRKIGREMMKNPVLTISRLTIIYHIHSATGEENTTLNEKQRAGNDKISRSQWLRGLRHELSSLARTLGSWV
jgi:hypothetical protein